MNNKDEIRLKHVLDQLNAAKEPLLQTIISQTEAINKALDEMPDDCIELTITINGNQYPLSLVYIDVINVLFQAINDISQFAKDEMAAG